MSKKNKNDVLKRVSGGATASPTLTVNTSNQLDVVRVHETEQTFGLDGSIGGNFVMEENSNIDGISKLVGVGSSGQKRETMYTPPNWNDFIMANLK